MQKAQVQYSHGWGSNALDAKSVTRSWDMFATDGHEKSTTIKFSLLEGSFPLTIGLNCLLLAKIEDRKQVLSFRRPTNQSKRTFATYTASDQQYNKRARLPALAQYRYTVISFSMNIHGQESHIVKKLHRVTHASKHNMMELFRDAGSENQKLFDRYDSVYNSRDICASTGRPKNKVKVSLKYVNKDFNQCIRADSTITYIADGWKQEWLAPILILRSAVDPAKGHLCLLHTSIYVLLTSLRL